MSNTVLTTTLTMTSREIADLVGSRPDSVKQTIERLAAGTVIELPPMVEAKNHLGQTAAEYIFSGEWAKYQLGVAV